MAYDRRDHLLTNETGVLAGSHYFISTDEVLRPELLHYVISCGHYYCNENYIVKREFYKYPLLAYVLEGELTLETGGKIHRATAGDVVCYNCHTPHRYAAGKHLEFAWLHTAGQISRQLYEEIYSTAGPVLRCGQNLYVYQKIEQVIQCFRQGKPLPPSQVSVVIYDILCRLYGETQLPKKMAGNQLVMAVIQFMRYNLVNHLTEEGIAASFGMETKQLAAEFKKYTGYTLQGYLNRLRLGLAQHLLATTQDPVEQIAASVGYIDSQWFCKCFEEEVGVPISRYRGKE